MALSAASHVEPPSASTVVHNKPPLTTARAIAEQTLGRLKSRCGSGVSQEQGEGVPARVSVDTIALDTRRRGWSVLSPAPSG